MPPRLALLIGAAFVVYAFLSDRKRDIGDTAGLFWPSLWYVVTASRPFGVWMYMWGVPLPGGSGDAADGSIVDRFFYATLTAIGLWILSRRRFNWGEALRRHRYLTIFFAFMALSIMWSDYPMVSFKRFIKVGGSIVMGLVVLTSDRPFDAVLTVLRRCLYIHLPMSIICTKYFRDIGVAYDWFGSMSMWQGISTSKNTLGQVAMLGVLYFSWEVRRRWREFGWRNLHVLYLLMALYLLKGSPSAISMTSLSVCVFALTLFFRIQALRSRPAALHSFVTKTFYVTVGFICLILIHSVVNFSEGSLFGFLITKFGRNITLTDRTYIWHDAYAAASSNPLLGVGYGGFWIGREANIPWNSTMTWVLAQAHNGYVDTYLQLGLVGGFLLARVLFATLPRLLASLDDDFDFGCFRITLFVTIMFINITESTLLRGDHHLWFLMQLTIWILPGPVRLEPAEIGEEDQAAAVSDPEMIPSYMSEEDEPPDSSRI